MYRWEGWVQHHVGTVEGGKGMVWGRCMVCMCNVGVWSACARGNVNNGTMWKEWGIKAV